MKIVVAPDSFKESMSAEVAAKAMIRGIESVLPDAECVCLPLADGGEGTAATLLAACGGRWRTLRAHDPLMREIDARYALLADGRAVIEMAEVAGLHLLHTAERDPLLTTTFGVGELLRDALDQGVRDITIAIGGSATNDGGSGLLRALGYQFLDAFGQAVPEGGAALSALQHIVATHVDERLAACRITVACDVVNPLCGAHGASAVFATQKGADHDGVRKLDDALRHFADVSAAFLAEDKRDTAGAGAAGGLGFALHAFLGAGIRSGLDLVADMVGLDAALAGADLVVTGEGKMDGQTASGKVPYGVLQRAKAQGVAVVALVGCLGEDRAALDNVGFTAILPIMPRSDDQETLLAQGEENLAYCARQVAALLTLR